MSDRPLVPLDGGTPDWPRRVANALNFLLRRNVVTSFNGASGDITYAGGGGAAVTLTVTAGETLNGHVAVFIASDGRAYKADNTLNTCRLTCGLTTGAAASGATATIQLEGAITEPTWNWSGTEVVWLSTGGALTQTVPTTNYAMQVGVPLGPTSLRIEPQLIAKF